METSFLSDQEIQDITEGLIARVMKETKGIDVTLPFPRMNYDDAMALYGSDKPDTRFRNVASRLDRTCQGCRLQKSFQKLQQLRRSLSKVQRIITLVKTSIN